MIIQKVYSVANSDKLYLSLVDITKRLKLKFPKSSVDFFLDTDGSYSDISKKKFNRRQVDTFWLGYDDQCWAQITYVDGRWYDARNHKNSYPEIKESNVVSELIKSAYSVEHDYGFDTENDVDSKAFYWLLDELNKIK